MVRVVAAELTDSSSFPLLLTACSGCRGGEMKGELVVMEQKEGIEELKEEIPSEEMVSKAAELSLTVLV